MPSSTVSARARRRLRAPLGAFLGVVLAGGALVGHAPPASAAVGPIPDIAPTGYVQTSDGTLIAVNVRMPDGFVEGKRYPTIFEMNGYDGASVNREDEKTVIGEVFKQFGQTAPAVDEGSRQLTKPFYSHYVTVHAAIRGTGCSGGEFDLFSWRSALDGREVIEWIAGQGWSNGKVGIVGHSYSGITGFMVAATQPPHLAAASVSGLVDDLYRGITYPGGVANVGFPVVWPIAIRTAYDVLGNSGQAIVTKQDPTCAANTATHTRNVPNDPVIQGLGSSTDDDWFREKSLYTKAHLVRVPTIIVGAYQDEQTGPRGPAHLWELLRGIPKRLILTNGDHGTNQSYPTIWGERVAWMDHWMRGKDHGYGTLGQNKTSVTTFFEMHRTDAGSVPNGRKDSTTFPLEDTRWRSYYLHQGGTLDRTKPTTAEPSDTYLSGTGRQSWNYQAGPTAGAELTTPAGPDELDYRTEPVAKNTAIAGPIVATLFASSTGPDTAFFVQLVDEGPDGSLTYLQRGLLEASFRAVDPGLADYVTSGGKRIMYRPYHPFTNPTLITPAQVYQYSIEVFPVGHVFRPGHRILVKIHFPPKVDSFYAYQPKAGPSLNTILHDSEHPSRILLPVVPLTGVTLGDELPCGAQEAVRCVSG